MIFDVTKKKITYNFSQLFSRERKKPPKEVRTNYYNPKGYVAVRKHDLMVK